MSATPAVSRRTPTGISGLDDLTGGGLPAGRVTVVQGGAGSGKTILALETLRHGAQRFSEPGLFVAFEERAGNVLADVGGFEWAADGLGDEISFLDVELPEPLLHGGDFDLYGLLATLEASVRRLGARRVVLDGIDVLLDLLGDPQRIRRELFRLRGWLLDSQLTAIITAKVGSPTSELAPGYDFLQFMADCVVSLQHEVVDSTAIRSLRVPKLRGAAHSANLFPFVISRSGIEVAAGSSAELEHRVFADKIGSGVPRLDAMLGGGYFRGSSILISGAPGTAKTTLASVFAEAACRRGERTLFVSFDEAPPQIARNLESVSVHLQPHIDSGLLRLAGLRSRSTNPEAHLSHIARLIRDHEPDVLIIDPLSALTYVSQADLAEAAALQIIDLAKRRGITVLSTTLADGAAPLAESTALDVSTVADTWIHLTYVSKGGERNRALTIVKSRGMAHSNQVRELVLSGTGVTLADVYMARGEVLMGTLRWQREQEEMAEREQKRRQTARQQRAAELALAETQAQISKLEHERQLRASDIERFADEETMARRRESRSKAGLEELRQADTPADENDRTGPKGT